MANSLEWKIRLGVNIITFLVGLLGNFSVLWILRKHKSKPPRPPYEYFIANLSVADMVFGVTLVMEDYFEIPRSLFVCKAVIPIVSVTFQVGMHTVAAIAIFRCKAILSPFKYRPSCVIIFGTIAGLWIFAHCSFIPFYIVLYFDDETGKCGEKWPTQALNKVYTVSLFIIQYVIPLVIIAICYTRIVMFLKQHVVPHSGSRKGNHLQVARKRKQDKLVMKMSVIIVLLYTLLTLPTQIAWLSWIVFENESIKDVVFMFSNELVLAHSCCNPIVYGLISKEFRKQLLVNCKALLQCLFCRKNRVIPIDTSRKVTINEYATRQT